MCIKKGVCPPYISKINSKCEKQIILLIIPIEEKEGWNYLEVRILSSNKFKHKGDFFLLKLPSFF